VNPELIIAALLGAPGVTALVGTRRALGQLPQGSAFPGVVYQVVDAMPTPQVSLRTPVRARARVQINPLAKAVPEVKAIHAAVRAALEQAGPFTAAGKRVLSCRFASLGPMDCDDDAGIWTQPADYLLIYDE